METIFASSGRSRFRNWAAYLLATWCTCGAVFGGNLTVSSTNVILSGGLSPTITTPYTATPFNFASTNGSNTAIKLSGNELFTSSGGTQTITISISGNATANAFDVFSVAYDFILSLTGSGTVTPMVSATGSFTISIPFLPPQNIPFNESSTLTPITGPATLSYAGVMSSDPVPVSASGNYVGSISFTWTGAANGDTLRVNVPANSIDFALAPTAIPEPGTMGLLGLGLLGVGVASRCFSRRV